MGSPSREANATVISRVEEVIESIVESLGSEKPISIPLLHQRHGCPVNSNPSSESSTSSFQLSFPGKTPEEAWRLTVVLRILDLIHEALVIGTSVSKRNIFYKDPSLFKTQATVDRYVDILACSLKVSRKALNICAAAKGLLAGHLCITNPDGCAVQRGLDGRPFIIDDPGEVTSVDLFQASWILVVEKESTFRTLSSAYLHSSSSTGTGIIITAKGYPDVSTRYFLHLMSSNLRHSLSAYALTDFDPDGVAIMSTYKYGSAALSHESQHLTAPCLQWLGLKSDDVLPIFQSNDASGDASQMNTSENHDGGLLRLSSRDRKKAAKLLENNSAFQEHGRESEWRREIQVMLMYGYKAEMECLDMKGTRGLLNWVSTKIMERVRT